MSHVVKVTFTDKEWAVLQTRIPHEAAGAYCRRIVMGEYLRHRPKRPKNASGVVAGVQTGGKRLPVTAAASRGEKALGEQARRWVGGEKEGA